MPAAGVVLGMCVLAPAALGGSGVDVATPLSARVLNAPNPSTVTVQNAGGNYIVIKIARGEYAFYAHLQPGNLYVKIGQRVKTGQVIARLGDTGNATAPHLHFHVMSSPSPLRSNGLPYVLSAFRAQGFLANGDATLAGQPASIQPRFAGTHRGQLPLNNEVLDFG
jgi:murein DD-endopeptidase MepM/ murein hydrolase activator NlpD